MFNIYVYSNHSLEELGKILPFNIEEIDSNLYNIYVYAKEYIDLIRKENLEILEITSLTEDSKSLNKKENASIKLGVNLNQEEKIKLKQADIKIGYRYWEINSNLELVSPIKNPNKITQNIIWEKEINYSPKNFLYAFPYLNQDTICSKQYFIAKTGKVTVKSKNPSVIGTVIMFNPILNSQELGSKYALINNLIINNNLSDYNKLTLELVSKKYNIELLESRTSNNINKDLLNRNLDI